MPDGRFEPIGFATAALMMGLLMLVWPQLFVAMNEYNKRQWGGSWRALDVRKNFFRLLGVVLMVLAIVLWWLAGALRF
jgi:hypothetical protein